MKKTKKRISHKKFNYTPYLLGLAMLLVIPMLRFTPFPDEELQLRRAAPNNAHLAVEMPISDGSFTIFNANTDERAGEGSGSSDLLGLSPGRYRVEFNEVIGYETPKAQIVELENGKLKMIEGFYMPYFKYPLLGLHMFPDTVQYNIIDVTTNTKIAGGIGSDFYSLPIGKYMIEFYDLEGYNKLPNQYFLIQPNTITTVNGAFGKAK